MTTNQTIDGVPRELLERLQIALSNSYCPEGFLLNELRALLDAPASPLSELEVLRAAVKELEAMRDARVNARLARRIEYSSLDPVERLSVCRGEQPVATEHKLHMGEAMKVFETLKVGRLSRRIDNEGLGPMGATQVEIWSTAIGITLEMQHSMGGCTLIIRTAPASTS